MRWVKKRKYTRNIHLRRRDVSKRARVNPFAKGQSSRIEQSLKIQAIILCIVLAVFFWILFFHPFFSIVNIQSSGLERIEQTTLDQSVRGILASKRFFIFPGSNYFLANIQEVREIIKDKFSVENIHVIREFPNNISIVIEERLSTVIFDNGFQYAYVGEDGKVTEIIRNVGDVEWQESSVHEEVLASDGSVTSTILITRAHIPPSQSIMKEMGNYPIIYAHRAEQSHLTLNQPVLNQEIISASIGWFRHFNENISDVTLSYVEVPETIQSDITLHTNQGWYIQIRLGEGSLEEQFSHFDIVRKEIPDMSAISYVDLRYNEKIFWK
jgi:cell division septal protein FtsQ